MGCKSCGEFAMARRNGRLLLDEFGHPILQLRSGRFSVDTLVHAERFLGLDGGGSISAPAAVRDSSHGPPNQDAAKHPTSAVGQTRRSNPPLATSDLPRSTDIVRPGLHVSNVFCRLRSEFCLGSQQVQADLGFRWRATIAPIPRGPHRRVQVSVIVRTPTISVSLLSDAEPREQASFLLYITDQGSFWRAPQNVLRGQNADYSGLAILNR
jgi:hypothetical protein